MCPATTTMPCSRAQTMTASAPGCSGANVIMRTGPASTSGQSTDASDTEPACVPNYDPCGFENLCCPDMYCRSGDCLQCKPPGSPCDGTWLGSECCEGGCAMQPDGERICQ